MRWNALTVKKSLTLWLVIIIMMSVVSCKKTSLPAVTTTVVSQISSTTAYSGGRVTSDGNDNYVTRGVCWHTETNPTIKNSRTNDSLGLGTFISQLTGLSPNTTYHVRAYATNSAGTAYGSDETFTTDDISVPEVTTSVTKSKSATSAEAGGEIVSDGGDEVTARGVCWNTTGGPTLSDNYSVDGSGSGVFYSTITGLTIGQTYYISAYATNSKGTAYGVQVIYTHIEPVTDIDGNAYSVITLGTQVWMTENLKTTTLNDGTPIENIVNGLSWAKALTPAYCWYSNSEPSYKLPYGALYNWYAVNTGKLCPTGWHVPTSAEFTVLLNYLGGLSVAGGKMKETGTTHWMTPNTGATNSSKFSAVPGGGRYNVYSAGGSFSDIGMYAYHWSSTEGTDTDKAVSYDMSYLLIVVGQDEFPKEDGGSVRCLKDSK